MASADAIKIHRSQAYSDLLARELHQLRVDGELANFTLHASTRSFRCHQTILAGVSPVFKAMFRSGMTETAMQEVNLEYISVEVMENLLTYAYTGEVDIPQETLVTTIQASDYLQLLELRELCLSEAVKAFCPSNAISTYKLADTLNIDTLKSKCSDFISSSLAEISKYEEFNTLTSAELSSFLKAAQESNVDPDELLEATLNWTSGKPDQRITSLESMVLNIELLQCTKECLQREMKKHRDLLKQCIKVHFILTNIVVQILKQTGSRKKHRSKPRTKQTESRKKYRSKPRGHKTGSVMARPDAIKIPHSQAYSDLLARELHQLRVDGELANITLHASTRSFRCHQEILAGVSPVFKTMFTSGMTETTKQEVNLEHISADVMDIILSFMYTGEVYIRQEQLLATIQASDYLQLLELKELCWSEAVEDFCPSNAISTYKLADTLNMDTLKSKFSDFISSSLAEISKYEEFNTLTSAELSSFLKAAQESNVDPDELLEATLDWISGKPDQRITSLESMLQNFDVLQCTTECIERENKKHAKLLQQCPKVHLLFTNGVVQIPQQTGSRKKYKSRPRGNPKFVIIGGSNNKNELNRVCWEVTAAGLKEVCRIQGHSQQVGVCKTPTGFVLTGGEHCKLCSMFDITTMEWRSLPSLSNVRHAHVSAYMGGEIFMFGGIVQESPYENSRTGSWTHSVQSLKIDGGEWKDEADIPMGRSDFEINYPAVASADSGIYLLDCGASKNLFYFDMETKVWSNRAPIPRVSHVSSMVCVDDQLLVAGTIQDPTFAHYNIRTDTWTTGKPPPLLPHWRGSLAYHKWKLYLMGGVNSYGPEGDQVEEYNMFTESWSVSDFTLPEILYHVHALVLYV